MDTAPPWRVICLCAQWCDVCRQYRATLAQLAARFGGHVFVWLDIETHEAVLGELDIETFPTLLIACGAQARFFGALPPHGAALARLLQTLQQQAGDEQAPVEADTHALLRRVLAARGLEKIQPLPA